MQAGPTGDPGKAPACMRTVKSAATMRPSLVAPSLTSIEPAEVGPDPRKTSSRLITNFTGLPAICDSLIASGSR